MASRPLPEGGGATEGVAPRIVGLWRCRMELKVDGRQIYAATGGRPFDPAKPVVIFIHGAGQDHTNWQLPARWFAWNGYAALAPDLPGHGRSDGPPLATIPDM